MICESCQKEFFNEWRKEPKKDPLRFCSLNCSRVRHRSEEEIKRRSDKKYLNPKYCVVCNNILGTRNQSGFCSKHKIAHEKKRSVKAVVKWRQKLKVKLVEYKGGKCAVCGYSQCIAALEFHHLDPEKKDYGMATGAIKSLERCKVEVDKCLLVCCRCHREIHAKIRDQNKTLDTEKDNI